MASLCKPYHPLFLERCRIPTRKIPAHRPRVKRSIPQCVLGITPQELYTETLNTLCTLPSNHNGLLETSNIAHDFIQQRLLLLDLDPATAKLVIPFVGPFLSGFGFLFIVRIVMSWYPKLPVDKFPYVVAYAPTEPILSPTRKVIRPIGGVDVSPVVWFGLLSFLNEILVGPQGLLVLLSQQTT